MNLFRKRTSERGPGRGLARWLSGGLAALLFGSAMIAGGGAVVPANAAEGASLMLVKQVKTLNGQYSDAARDLRPGDAVTYRVEFRVNDEDADAPVRVADELPVEFSGWELTGLTAVVGGSSNAVTLDLPGVTSGPSPSGPVSGTVGATAAERTITVGVEQTVQPGAGNTSGLGMSTRDTGVLEYTLRVPATLSPTDPILRRDLVNTATFTAKSGAADLSTSDTALISVDNPVAVDVIPAKSWTPASQSFQPGQTSQISIGGTQASNVDATSLSLQDPADPALAPDGANSLPAGNPFNYVDFTGFTAPNDPTANLPSGATSASVEVYRLSGGTWNWVTWDASIPNADIAGVRMSYAGSIPPGASVSQGFDVAQRVTNRSTGASVSGGYDVANKVRATVQVPGQDQVSKEAEAPFAVAPEQIDVSAQKRFYALPSGGETENLAGVTAGDSVGVVLRGINGDIPQSTALDSLTIAEPAAGSDEKFFGEDLIFGGFDNSDPAKAWPAGATGATLTWSYGDGSTSDVDLAGGAALPAPAGGKTVAGFSIVFTGEIAPGAHSEIRYRLDSSESESFVAPGKTTPNYKNVIDVTGKKAGLPDEHADASATVSYVAPSIKVTIDKRVGPGAVLPGQNVVVQLDTKAETTGGRTKPTEIVVEDSLTGDGTFWDAFDAKQILPPITRPTNSGDPAKQADLTIRYRQADGTWVDLATNPDEGEPIAVPAGATGLRFVYTNDDGFSQISYVKPNILFEARTALRSDGSKPTSGTFDTPIPYENTALADSTGKLGERTVTGHDDDKKSVGIRGTENGTGPGPGGLWASKTWNDGSLTSQSGATSWTTQSWAVTQEGYETVVLQDPDGSGAPSATGAGTVFEAFDLTHIRPIRFAAGGSNNTVDPMLKWDVVTAVELWDGENWNPVEVPGGSWMDANGFKGYALTPDQQQSTLGVRLVLAENAAAREAARSPENPDGPDLTAPEPGSGVAASAETRSYRLDWQLRDRARTADGSLKWVKEKNTAFNCSGGGDGCVDNVFGVTAKKNDGTQATARANDTIQLIDGVTNVALTKSVTSADSLSQDAVELVVPNPGELAQADYPTARYTLTAKNSSTRPEHSIGAMKLGKIRVTDTSTHQLETEPSFNIDESPFAARSYTTEVNGPEGNHFDVFNLTGVSFDQLPAYIDTTDSTVELWLYEYGGATGESTLRFTLQQVLDHDAAFLAALSSAIGIDVTYSGQDPAQNGNRIAVGDNLVVHLDVQLRATERLSGEPVTGGTLDSVVNVPNEAIARGWDAVVDPNTEPTSRSDANVQLSQARVRVGLDKTVSVAHGGTSDKTVTETDPQAPVNVLLTANPNKSTAPLNTLSIEDTTASFWDRFEFVSFGDPVNPADADRATLQVRVGGGWTNFAGYAGSLADIRGVRVVFDRSDAGVFPQGATSWNASWGNAKLPFTVKLRAGAAVDWDGDAEENTATVVANNVKYGRATTSADDEVTFSPGVHRLRVEKRAPNDTFTHEVEALASMPWKLVFTNTGTSYLPITKVTDAMPAELSWDGEAPVATSIPAAGGTSGVTGTPRVTVSPDGKNIVFEWAPGTRMQPGERVEIALGLIMEPVAAGKRAVNEVVVETGVPLASCEQPRDFGQDPQQPAAANECSNTNFVQPRVGTVIGARKTVSGEPGQTLGEDLVSGALDARTLEECAPGGYLPIGSDYTRNPCASYTAVGATDTWKLENINSGTNPLARMTVVDMLPTPGDRMLAGGASRASTFRPVLRDVDGIRLSGLPEDAAYTIDVTVNPTACVGTEPGGSLWASDPGCSDATTNPANVWTPLAEYTGAVQDIAGLRFNVDMSATPLQPGGNVIIEFETVNRVVDVADGGLLPTLAQFQERQFAWNQNGVIAWDTNGTRVNLPAAPQRAGVTVKTGSLVVSKEVTGLGADRAPASFEVELACTVPSGLDGQDGAERVALDLGDSAVLTVPKNGSVTVDGIPIGADCTAREAGALGAFGENARAIAIAPGVDPAADGQSAGIRIREQEGDGETRLVLTNGYSPLPPAPGNPGGLTITGAPSGDLLAAAALGILALGAGLIVAAASRRHRRGAAGRG